MNNRPHTVIGVLPPFRNIPRERRLHADLAVSHPREREVHRQPEAGMMTAFARLKPGVPLAQAQADLSVVAGW